MKIMQVFVIAVVSSLGNARQPLPSASASFSTTETAQVPVQMRAIVDALAGTWSITWTDKDGRLIGKGEEVWKIAPGGIPFIEENRSTVNGKPAEDYAAMWWDGKAQTVHGIWCDATINDEVCNGFNVSLDGKDVVLTGEWEYQGKRQSWREVLSATRTALTQTLYVGEPGKESKPAPTIHGTKR